MRNRAATASAGAPEDDLRIVTSVSPVPNQSPTADVHELLVDWSSALHKSGMYPPGHPALAPVVAGFHRRVSAWIAEAGRLAVDVGQRQLFVGEMATDPRHPLLSRLAQTLHRHGLAAVTMLPGVAVDEVAEMLTLLAREPERDAATGGADQQRWPHVRLHPLSFDGLALDDDGTAGEAPPHHLWTALAQVARAGDGAVPAQGPDDPVALARALADASLDESRSRGVVGGLAAMMRELRHGGGVESLRLRQQADRLLGALDGPALGRLVQRLAVDPEGRACLHDAVHGLGPASVVALLAATGDATAHPLAPALLPLLTKLASSASAVDPVERADADRDLRLQAEAMLDGWAIARPFRTVAPPPAIGDDAASVDPRTRVLEIAAVCDASGRHVEELVSRLAADGRHADLLAVFAVTAPDSGLASTLRAHLLRPDVLGPLLAGPPTPTLDRLLDGMAKSEYGVLFDMLADTQHRQVRRRLIDRLATTAVDLRAPIVERLRGDARWFVQRNMLVLLERSRLPLDLDVSPWATHEDVRVRQQAIRVWLQQPGARVEAVRAALADGHPRLVHAALSAVQESCETELASAVTAVALDESRDRDLRLLAIQACGHCRAALALEALLALTDGGKSLFGRQRLPPDSPIVNAALRALGAWEPRDARAAARRRLAAGRTEEARA